MRAPGSHEKGKSCFKPTQLSSQGQKEEGIHFVQTPACCGLHPHLHLPRPGLASRQPGMCCFPQQEAPSIGVMPVAARNRSWEKASGRDQGAS